MFLVTFEGTEGSGKSTLIRLLSEQLNQLNIAHIITREPGGSAVAESIRHTLLNQDMAPMTELLLYEAARAEHFHSVIAPALKEKKLVLCDRFTDSTLAYQGYARGLDLTLIQKLNTIATQGLKPKLTFFLDLPVEEGLARAQDPNRFEAAGVEFQKKVRKGFLATIRKSPSRFVVLKVSGKTPDTICQMALGTLVKKLKLLAKIQKTKKS